MFKSSPRIPCYVLIYKEVGIIKKSLNFFASLSEHLELVVIENPSNNSPQLKKFIDALGETGKVSRHYFFKENITNNAFDVVLQAELKRIRKSRYVIVSDGDLTLESGLQWLEETKEVLQHKEVFCCGAGMLMDNLPIDTFPEAKNWIPEIKNTGAYNEGRTGCHLLTMSGKNFAKFMKWKDTGDRYFTDAELAEFCYNVEHNKWGQTRANKAYHHTWDLYSDLNHPYTRLKTDKSFEDTWYHKKQSSFEITKY